jgi:LysM domain
MTVRTPLTTLLTAWETSPGRPGADVLHGHGTGALRPAPARRRDEQPVRPRRLAASRHPTPPVVACRRVFLRRRIVALAVLVLGTLVVAGIVVGLALLGSSAAESEVPDRTIVVQVAPGETLWELAERVAPASPTGQVVERIRELNGMRGITIHPGQPLIVPDGGVLTAPG